MKLTFLGTRGTSVAGSRRHQRHASLIVQYRGQGVMIDCGTDLEEEVESLRPCAIVLTHGDPNHAGGLQRGVPCPVLAPIATLQDLSDYGIRRRKAIRLRKPVDIHGMVFEAFPVDASRRAPTVGYRISAGMTRIFYAPNVACIHYRHDALRGVNLYIGGGANLEQTFVRRGPDPDMGRASVSTQLTWCRQAGIRRAIITHCGRAIIESDPRHISMKIKAQGRNRDIDVRLAYDGLEIILHPRRVYA